MFTATAARDALSIDAAAAAAGSWRIAAQGTPWFDGVDIDRVADANPWLATSPNGHVTAQRTAGPILVGVPFYWLLGDPDSATVDYGPGGVAASVLTGATVALLFGAMRRRTGDRVALIGALAFAFATPTWSVSADALWTHTVTQFGIAGAAWSASRDRWALAGVFMGVAIFGRPHIALIAATLGLGVALARRDWRVTVKVGAPALAGLALLMVWNRLVHGPWSVGGAYGDTPFERAVVGVSGAGFDQLTNYLGFLVAPDRGFLVWTPAVLLFLPALWRGRDRLTDWSIWLAIGGIVYTFFQLRLNYFAGGDAFHSYRHGLELLTCIMPALCMSARSLGRVARALLPVVLSAQCAAFAIGAAVHGYYLPVEQVWKDNGFWLALRHNPEVVGGWLTFWLIIGIWLSIRFMPYPPRPIKGDTSSDASTLATPQTAPGGSRRGGQ